MPLHIIENDIVCMATDAIVNAANRALRPGSGVCGAIFRAAGYDELARACREIGHCEVGEAVITPGFRLSARYIIHAVGPIWQGGCQNEAQLLRSSYVRSLELAVSNGCKSIAFPLISSGVYGYPREDALDIAVKAIREFLEEHELTVYLVLYKGRAAVADRSNV